MNRLIGNLIFLQLLFFVFFMLTAGERVLAQTKPNRSSEKPSAKKLDCNAFYKWSSIEKAKLPTSPSELSTYLQEGNPYPSGEARRKLDLWLNEMAPFTVIVDEGCKCKTYSDPVDKSGRTDLDAMSNSNMLLWNVDKYHSLMVKKLLVRGEFSKVQFEIRKLFEQARTGNGGSRVLVSLLTGYSLPIKYGLASMRECLYWRDCPESLLHELLSLLVGMEDREVASKAVTAECNFMETEILAQKAPDFFDSIDEGNLTEGNQENKRLLEEVLSDRKMDFNPRATVSLLKTIGHETVANALLPPVHRKTPALNKLREELAPLLSAFASKNKTKLSYNDLSPKLAKVSNLIGKLMVLDTERSLATVIDVEDRLILQIAGTEILIHINQFERSKKYLPQSLDNLEQSKLISSLKSAKWNGFELKYSPSARTLAFIATKPLKNPEVQKELFWTIPKPDLRN